MNLQPWVPVIGAALTVVGSLLLALINRGKRESRERETGVPHADAYTEVLIDLLHKNDRLRKQNQECHAERDELRRKIGGM